MAERWKTLLGRVPEIEPDVERLRSLTLDGPRLLDPPSATPERRIAVAAFAMAIAVAAFALVFVALREDPRALPAGERDPADSRVESASTYVFSDVVAGPSTAEPDDLAVTFSVSWSGEDYPGVHMCTYVALGADGSVIGEVTRLAAWRPGRWYRDVPGDPEAAVRGEVSCDPERLDDPGIADVTPIPRPEETTLDEVMAERADRLKAWAARWSVDSMTESQLAGNMWALNAAMTQGYNEDFTVTWQLADRRHYLCVRLPPEHEFRGGEFCD